MRISDWSSDVCSSDLYAQRATPGGLLIAEASQVVPSGQGYPATPGIYSAEQIEGWHKVTSAVHAKGGAIFLQLLNVGRISHSSFQSSEERRLGKECDRMCRFRWSLDF